MAAGATRFDFGWGKPPAGAAPGLAEPPPIADRPRPAAELVAWPGLEGVPRAARSPGTAGTWGALAARLRGLSRVAIAVLVAPLAARSVC